MIAAISFGAVTALAVLFGGLLVVSTKRRTPDASIRCDVCGFGVDPRSGVVGSTTLRRNVEPAS